MNDKADYEVITDDDPKRAYHSNQTDDDEYRPVHLVSDLKPSQVFVPQITSLHTERPDGENDDGFDSLLTGPQLLNVKSKPDSLLLNHLHGKSATIDDPSSYDKESYASTTKVKTKKATTRQQATATLNIRTGLTSRGSHNSKLLEIKKSKSAASRFNTPGRGGKRMSIGKQLRSLITPPHTTLAADRRMSKLEIQDKKKEDKLYKRERRARFEAKLAELNVQNKGAEEAFETHGDVSSEIEDPRFAYLSDTEDEMEYFSRTNISFKKWSQEKQLKHVLGLWRQCYVRCHAVGQTVNLILLLRTKMAYLGRQKLGLKASKRLSIFESLKISKPTIEPRGDFKAFWDKMIIIALLYMATYAPYRTAFYQESPTGLLAALELFFDLVFIADIFITFMTPFELSSGEYEGRYKEIAHRYFAGDFTIDFISALPFHWLEGRVTSVGGPKLLRIFKFQKILRLLRLFKLVKFLKYAKYHKQIENVIHFLNFTAQTQRLISVLAISAVAMHVFACFFYMGSAIHDFGPNTWVHHRGFTDESPFDRWWISIYWAAQTLSTVGYGDFGAYNALEIFITIVWMFIGVALYSVGVGAMTTMMIEREKNTNSLHMKLKALAEFSKQAGLDPKLEGIIAQFLHNNFEEFSNKLQFDALLQDLPLTIKEELLFYQYGSLMNELSFLQLIHDNEIVWGVMSNLIKANYLADNEIYAAGSYSDAVYFILKGKVILRAENGFTFKIYRNHETFGDSEVLCDLRRCGSAIAIEQTTIYYVKRDIIHKLLKKNPALRRKMIEDALEASKKLMELRYKALQADPIYGLHLKRKQAYQRLRSFSRQLDQKEDMLFRLQTRAQPEQTPIREVSLELEDDLLDDPEEYKLEEHLGVVTSINQNDEANDKFSEGVHTLVHTLKTEHEAGVRNSLNFHHQQLALMKEEKLAFYTPSKRLRHIKQSYFDQGTGHLRESDIQNPLSSHQADYESLKENIRKELPNTMEVELALQYSGSLQTQNEKAAQDAAMVINECNEGLKQVYMSAYQMHELMQCSIEEMEVIREWMEHLEQQTLQAEEQLIHKMDSLAKEVDSL